MRKCALYAVALLGAALLGGPALGQSLTINFENYTAGNAIGQDSWTLLYGTGDALIVTTDNGPGGSGSKCLELRDQNGTVKMEKLFADLVGATPKLVTYKYDFRIMPNSSGYFCRPEIPGGLVGHWHTNWSQWTGAYRPDGTDWQWSWGTTGWSLNDWHTHKWNMIYTTHDGGKGQLLSYQLDNGTPDVRYAAQQCYIRNDQALALDRLLINYENADADPDVIHMDNISIVVSSLPSQIPVANAGPDLSGPPDQYYTLNGSASSDDGAIVKYRWTTGARNDAVLYEGTNPAPSVFMPGGTYTVMLEVFDAHGLRDTDTMECSFAYVPTNPLVIDFEGYNAGNVAGQDGWVLTQTQGTATVITTDNGPSGAGSKCLRLNNSGFTSGEVKVQKGFADLLANYGPIVTFEYDYKGTANGGWVTPFLPQLPGAAIEHWHAAWIHWQGSRTANGWDWGEFSQPHSGWEQWHRFRWTVLYNDRDGGKGQLLSYQFDDENVQYVYAKDACYIRGNLDADTVDMVTLALGNWGDPNDVVLVDNIRITATAQPSEFPTADAGPDVLVDPGTWDGTVLDGGNSSDDGGLVRYRWTVGWGGPLVYDGPEAQPLVDLPTGTYTLVLEVFDADGLRDTDTAECTVGPKPPIVDDVAGPWGIVNGNIYGTNSSDGVPVLVGPEAGFVIEDVVELDGWYIPEDHCALVFDRFGNLYYMTRLSKRLVSFDANLQFRWLGRDSNGNEVGMGDWSNQVGDATIIAGIRYVYAVGGGQDNAGGNPAVYAFDKSTGVLVWQTTLPGEDWRTLVARPKFTLYNDKLYVIGIATGDDLTERHVWQLNAATGAIEWTSMVLTELNWEQGDPGSVAFVPNAFGANQHGLFLNNRSDHASDYAAADFYADMVALKINPTPGSGGATTMWGPGSGVEGPYLEYTHTLYSPVTNMVYTVSRQQGETWPYAAYAWSPTAGLQRTFAIPQPEQDDVEHHHRRTRALDFDGRTLHAAGEWDTIRSYTDLGNGTWNYAYREYGGYAQHGWGFEFQGALVQADNGHAILYTMSREAGEGSGGIPAKLVALDLSAPVNPDGDQPLASIAANEWDAANNRWNFRWYNCGPTPGPDGTVYIVHHRDGGDRCRIVRFGATPAVPGACCLPDASCVTLTAYNCAQAGGSFIGEGSSCAETICTGACCVGATCVELTPALCEANGGISAGHGSFCDLTVCAQAEVCSGAIPVTVPGFACGDTTDATIQNVQAFGCGASAADGPDVWYMLTGTGYNITATLCDSLIYWDTQLAIYTGTCTGLVCVASADDTCGGGGHAEITFASTAGTTYLLRVFGWDYQMGEFGPFVLALSDDAPQIQVCVGDLNCDGAVSFGDINPFVLRLSNPAAYAAAYPDCPGGNADVNGNGSVGFDDINPFVALMSSGQGPCD